MINIIVAYDKNRLIGSMGTIPWKLPEDMRFFKETTLGHPIIMGWNTWKSLNYKPLKLRSNIILSKTKTSIYSDVYVARSVYESVDRAKKTSEDIFVIGGEQVYRSFLDENMVDRVIATEIKGEYLGDTYFPYLKGEWSTKILRETSQFNIVEYNKGD